MVDDTLLLRQVHPSFIHKGRVTSQAFRPTPKDQQKLSVYRGDLISAVNALKHYRSVLNLESVGVLGVTVGECAEQHLPVSPDPKPFLEHVVIDFSNFPNNQVEKKSKLLKKRAEDRGWLYREA